MNEPTLQPNSSETPTYVNLVSQFNLPQTDKQPTNYKQIRIIEILKILKEHLKSGSRSDNSREITIIVFNSSIGSLTN